MPKTRNAFALRDFDRNRLWKRPFFKFNEGEEFFKSRFFDLPESDDVDMYEEFKNLWYLEPEVTDENILDAYREQAIKIIYDFPVQSKHCYDRIESIAHIMFGIIRDIVSYKEKINRHYKRLKKYSKKWNDTISANENLSAKEIRTKTRRVQTLLKFYADVQKAIENFAYSITKRVADIDDAYKKKDRDIFATRLRQARIEAKLTQTQLAKEIGMTQSGYTNYENSIREPSIVTLKKLSRILNKSADWLLGLTP